MEGTLRNGCQFSMSNLLVSDKTFWICPYLSNIWLKAHDIFAKSLIISLKKCMCHLAKLAHCLKYTKYVAR